MGWLGWPVPAPLPYHTQNLMKTHLRSQTEVISLSPSYGHHSRHHGNKDENNRKIFDSSMHTVQKISWTKSDQNAPLCLNQARAHTEVKSLTTSYGHHSRHHGNEDDNNRKIFTFITFQPLTLAFCKVPTL